MPASPTQRTLAKLRKEGWIAAVVEHWNPHARIRQDLFKCVDVLGIGPQGTIAVQATSYANVSSRVTKVKTSPHIAAIHQAGWKIEVHGWRKVKHRWECRVVEVGH